MDIDSTVPVWLTPPPFPVLNRGQVHIWLAELDQPDEQVQACSSVLSPEEQDRAGRFLFERDRRRFRVSHGFLRQVLSGYLDLPARFISYTYGPHRKPALASSLLTRPLNFNLAHSQELALLGVTSNSEIGVDIEYHRLVKDRDQVAATFFSARENSSLLSLPGDQQEAGFFNAWTRKEAYLKGLGDGLARPLDSFAVSLAPGLPATLIHVDGLPDEPGRWHILSFTPQPRYTAAVALDAASTAVSYFLWQPAAIL